MMQMSYWHFAAMIETSTVVMFGLMYLNSATGLIRKEMMMVAAHAWDITGAAVAGCRTAFIARPGKVLNPAGSQPDLHCDDLQDFARQLLAWRER